MTDRPDAATLTSSNRQAFIDYYAAASQSPAAVRRFRGQRDHLLSLAAPAPGQRLDVVDLGCGAGTASSLWAEAGHRAYGIDISEELVRLATTRCRAAEQDAHFLVGSAHAIPLPDASADIVLAPELLEHVPDWEGCVREIARVLRPGGYIFLSTTNTLCPRQQEFTLPLFSWYPAPLKRRYIRLAQTTRPELANYATYPAFHWFSFYSLRRHLRGLGFTSFWTRFDLMAQTADSPRKKLAARIFNTAAPTRLLGQMLTPGTQIYARKDG